jgi:hypothetical protein
MIHQRVLLIYASVQSLNFTATSLFMLSASHAGRRQYKTPEEKHQQEGLQQ